MSDGKIFAKNFCICNIMWATGWLIIQISRLEENCCILNGLRCGVPFHSTASLHFFFEDKNGHIVTARTTRKQSVMTGSKLRPRQSGDLVVISNIASSLSNSTQSLVWWSSFLSQRQAIYLYKITNSSVTTTRLFNKMNEQTEILKENFHLWLSNLKHFLQHQFFFIYYFFHLRNFLPTSNFSYFFQLNFCFRDQFFTLFFLINFFFNKKFSSHFKFYRYMNFFT